MNSSATSNQPTEEKAGPLAVFSIPQFRWLFLGNATFFLAMNGQMLTRTLLAWDLTGSATSLAYINLVVAIPMIFASVVGGAITDRVERRQLVIVGQSLIVANEIFILTLMLTGYLEFWHLLCTAFVAGCAFPFIMPARMAITATVVGPDKLQSAMAYSGSIMNLSRVFGPALMGVIIAQLDYQGAYMLSITLYSSAVLCMFGVNRSRSGKVGDVQKGLFDDIGQGFRYIRHNRPVLLCLLFGLVPMFLAMPFQSILVMLAEQEWGVGESGMGTLMAVGGLGGLLGSLWIVKRGDSPRRVKLMLWSTIAFGGFLAVFVLTSNFYVALLPLLFANLYMSASQTVNNAAIQLLIDDSVRGRMSSFMMLSYALTPIGVFPMALAADRVGAANSILGACALLLVVVALFYFMSKTLRGLDSSVAAKVAETVAARAAALEASKVASKQSQSAA